MRVVPRVQSLVPSGAGLIFIGGVDVSKKEDKYSATLNLPQTEFLGFLVQERYLWGKTKIARRP